MQHSDARKDSAAGRASWWAALVLAAVCQSTLVSCGEGPTSLEHGRKLVQEGDAHYGQAAEADGANREQEMRAAIECYESALELLDEQNAPLYWARASFRLALCYSNLGEHDKAIPHGEAALRVYGEKTHPEEWARTNSMLAIAHQQTEDRKRAIEHFEAALRVYQEHTHPDKWADTNYLLALCYHRAEDLDQAVAHYQAALRIYREDTDPVEWADTNYWLAACYQDNGMFEQAVSHFQRALSGFEAAGDQKRAEEVRSAIAEINAERHQHAAEEARPH